jgi:Spy/CpxP family protein refolding chaperone
MKKSAKITLGTLIATIATIGLTVTGVATAHNADSEHVPGMMGHNKMGGAYCDKEARAAEHLNTVKEQLKLTEAQTGAWQAFETAVTQQMESMPKGHMSHDNGSGKMEDHIAFMEQRLDGMKTVLQARNDLYAVLTPDQKAVADKLMQHESHMGHHH